MNEMKMQELNQEEIDVVSGAGILREYYDDAIYIHGDLVDRLSTWMFKTFG